MLGQIDLDAVTIHFTFHTLTGGKQRHLLSRRNIACPFNYSRNLGIIFLQGIHGIHLLSVFRLGEPHISIIIFPGIHCGINCLTILVQPFADGCHAVYGLLFDRSVRFRSKKDIAALHTELVNSYAPACSQFVCDNARLRDFIASRTEARAAAQYQERISQVRESITGNTRGMVMKKEEMTSSGEMKTNRLSNTLVAILVAGAAGLLIFIIRRKRNQP